MDFPIAHFDTIGNRGLIALIAICHVIINHGLAVGLMPLVAAMEWYGHKKKDPRWDRLAYRILFFAFLITTTIGALTGVGIWFSVSLVNPYSIGSLIRVFFWGWFTEWLVFITEVVLILAYCLTWKTWTGEKKQRHILLGFALAAFSWITMAIIVSILGFMMDPGNWLTHPSLWAGLTNPVYLPQLAFRTPLALTFGALIALMLTLFFTGRNDPFRAEAVRAISLFTLCAAPFVFIGGYWYYSVVPDTMKANLAVSMLTLQFTDWQSKLLWGMAGAAALVMAVAQFGVLRPRLLPRPLLILPLLAIVWLTGHFERVREFIRKPYIIGEYMYANGLRVEDYPLYAETGILAHATYSHRLSTEERSAIPAGMDPARIQQGKDVFMVACSRCHTGAGVNAVRTHFTRLFGDTPWVPDTTLSMIQYMHESQPYMPPFPGNAAELELLAEYLSIEQAAPVSVAGAQITGVDLNVPAPPEQKIAQKTEVAP